MHEKSLVLLPAASNFISKRHQPALVQAALVKPTRLRVLGGANVDLDCPLAGENPKMQAARVTQAADQDFYLHRKSLGALDQGEDGLVYEHDASNIYKEDKIELILWYKLPANVSQSHHQQPIYSVDGRQQQATSSSSSTNRSDTTAGLLELVAGARARHHAHSSRLRLQFQTTQSPLDAAMSHEEQANVATRGLPLARLRLEAATREDAGLYKCRVDFRYARTRTQLIKLDVIEPVSELEIKIRDSEPAAGDQQQQQTNAPGVNVNWIGQDNNKTSGGGKFRGPKLVQLAGNQSLEVACQAKNGWPDASVAWWRLSWPERGANVMHGRAASITQLSLGASRSTSALLQVSSELLMPEWRKLQGHSLTSWLQIIEQRQLRQEGVDARASDLISNNKSAPTSGSILATTKPSPGDKKSLGLKLDAATNWLQWMGQQLLDRSSSATIGGQKSQSIISVDLLPPGSKRTDNTRRNWLDWLQNELMTGGAKQPLMSDQVALLVCGASNLNPDKMTQLDAGALNGVDVDDFGADHSSTTIPEAPKASSANANKLSLLGDKWAPKFQLLPIQLEAGPSWLQILQIIRTTNQIVRLVPLESGSTVQLKVASDSNHNRAIPVEPLELLCLGSFWPRASQDKPTPTQIAGFHWHVSSGQRSSIESQPAGYWRQDSSSGHAPEDNDLEIASKSAQIIVNSEPQLPSSNELRMLLEKHLSLQVEGEKTRQQTIELSDLDYLGWIGLKLNDTFSWHAAGNGLKIECSHQDYKPLTQQLNVEMVSPPILNRPQQVTNGRDTMMLNSEKNEQQSPMKPVVVGQQTSLHCPIVFANPRLLPISGDNITLDWLVNGNVIRANEVRLTSKPGDKKKIRQKNRKNMNKKSGFEFVVASDKQDKQVIMDIDSIEGANIVFSLRNQGLHNFTCRARNELGLGQSVSQLSLLAGHKPRCLPRETVSLQMFSSTLSTTKRNEDEQEDKDDEVRSDADYINDSNVNIPTIQVEQQAEAASGQVVELNCPLEIARDNGDDDDVRYDWMALDKAPWLSGTKHQKAEAHWVVITSSQTKPTIELWKLYQQHQQHLQRRRQAAVTSLLKQQQQHEPATDNVAAPNETTNNLAAAGQHNHQSLQLDDKDNKRQNALRPREYDTTIIDSSQEAKVNKTFDDSSEAYNDVDNDSKRRIATFACFGTNRFGSNFGSPCLFNVVIPQSWSSNQISLQKSASDSSEDFGKLINPNENQNNNSRNNLVDQFGDLKYFESANNNSKNYDHNLNNRQISSDHMIISAVNSQKRSSQSVDRFMRTSSETDLNKDKFWELGIGIGVSLLGSITLVTLVLVYRNSRSRSNVSSKRQKRHQKHYRSRQKSSRTTIESTNPCRIKENDQMNLQNQQQQQMVSLGQIITKPLHHTHQAKVDLGTIRTTSLSPSSVSQYSSRQNLSDKMMMQPAVVLMKPNLSPVMSSHYHQANHHQVIDLSKDSSLTCSCNNHASGIDSRSSQHSFTEMMYMTPSPMDQSAQSIKNNTTIKSILKEKRMIPRTMSPVDQDIFIRQQQRQANELNSFGEQFVTDETSSINHDDFFVLITPNADCCRHQNKTLTMISPAVIQTSAQSNNNNDCGPYMRSGEAAQI